MPRKSYYDRFKDKLMQKQRQKRAQEKRQKEEQEAKTLIPKPVSQKYPLSWEDYKEHFPDAKFSDYLQEKIKFEKANRGEILRPEIEQILERNLYPLKGFDCKRFRLMITGFILPKDSFFCANHHTSCESCQKWYHEWKLYNRGANPW
jgi:hypothetical protein